jgi:3-oxoacyl-[acyl-carrier-protein] synthase-3
VLAIDEIAVVEPASRLSLAEEFETLGLDSRQARVYARLYGFDEVPFARPGEEFPILAAAVEKLLANAGVEPARVGVIVHAHSGPYIGPVGQSVPRLLVRRFGPDVLSFGMQLHKCASSLSALGVVERLLAVRPAGTLAVLLTGECADSKDLRALEMGVAGDIACAVLLSRDGARDRLLAQTVAVHGQYAGGIYDDPKAATRREYEATFQDNLQQVIESALDRAGVGTDALRYVLPHNVNVHIWRKAADRLGIGHDRLYLANVPRFAHCFGADVFLNLAAVRAGLEPGDHLLLASVGVGGTFSAAVLRH